MTDHNKHINDLINRCLHNEQAAFYEVYNTYYHMVYNTTYRMLNDTAEAEDVMQEAFITAFDKLKMFKRKSRYDDNTIPFAAWLKRIAINKCINHLRKNKNMPVQDMEVVHQRDQHESNEYEQNLSVEKVLSEINKLKPNYKLILTLHLIEGYDYEEMSEILNLTYANVRTLVSRAKAKLREKLQILIKNTTYNE